MKSIFIMLFSLPAILLLQSGQLLTAQTKLIPDSKIYRTVEQMPRFPGGMEALQKYFRENVHYPQSAIDSNVQGRVMVEFVIAQTGEITRVSVIKSANPALDSEAVRVVSAMPKWEPAVQKGQKVNVYYKVPISFKLQEDVQPSKDSLRNVTPDVMPQYEGGKDALLAYLRDSVRYPKEAIKRKIQGSVIVEFVIDENGNVTEVKSLKGLEGGCTEEAIRIIKATSGKWSPALKDDKPVAAHFTVPVAFRLQ